MHEDNVNIYNTIEKNNSDHINIINELNSRLIDKDKYIIKLEENNYLEKNHELNKNKFEANIIEVPNNFISIKTTDENNTTSINYKCKEEIVDKNFDLNHESIINENKRLKNVNQNYVKEINDQLIEINKLKINNKEILEKNSTYNIQINKYEKRIEIINYDRKINEEKLINEIQDN